MPAAIMLSHDEGGRTRVRRITATARLKIITMTQLMAQGTRQRQCTGTSATCGPVSQPEDGRWMALSPALWGQRASSPHPLLQQAWGTVVWERLHSERGSSQQQSRTITNSRYSENITTLLTLTCRRNWWQLTVCWGQLSVPRPGLYSLEGRVRSHTSLGSFKVFMACLPHGWPCLTTHVGTVTDAGPAVLEGSRVDGQSLSPHRRCGVADGLTAAPAAVGAGA